GCHHNPSLQRNSLTLIMKLDSRRIAWSNRLHRDAAADLSPGSLGQFQHRFLHRWMKEIERPNAVGRRGADIPVEDGVTTDPCCPPPRLIAATCSQMIVDTKLTC